MLNLIKPLCEHELEKVVDYFLNLSPEDDKRMSIARKILPSREKWVKLLVDDSHNKLTDRQFYYLGWLLNGKIIGHCGINKIQYGKEAYFHLHLWNPNLRKQGLSTNYLRSAIHFYFEKFLLQKIIAEPKTENIAPNKALLKAGFVLIDTYLTKPSDLNYKHQVNRYELTKSAFGQY